MILTNNIDRHDSTLLCLGHSEPLSVLSASKMRALDQSGGEDALPQKPANAMDAR